jgi:hypothetical protein
MRKGGWVTLKMLCRQSKLQFENQKRNMQSIIELLNYLKRTGPQQSMLRTQVFTKKCFIRKEHKRNFLK